MDHDTAHTTAIDTLETLGFNHYEAACFTALTRLSHGTTKELSELTDVALTETFETVPDATVRCKQVAASSGTTRLPLIWIDSSEQSALRDALAHDPTVTTADRFVCRRSISENVVQKLLYREMYRNLKLGHPTSL